LEGRAATVADNDRDARAAVEALRGAMAAEYAARREWWRIPVEGWREGRLTICSAVTGEATIIELRQRSYSK